MPYLDAGRVIINDLCKNCEPWQIILYTAAITFGVTWLYNLVYSSEKSMYIT